jgi:transcriptional regulator with XRE-family HTH domain
MKAGTFQRRLSDAIRKRREATGLSQERFADLAGMHRAQSSRLERGQTNMTVGTLERICVGLKVRLADIAADAEV